jgi:hypothetical protein
MQYRESTTSTTRQLIAYGEEYFPLGHTDYGKTVDKITSSGAEVVFNTIVPPGLTPFLERPIAVTSTAASSVSMSASGSAQLAGWGR